MSARKSARGARGGGGDGGGEGKGGGRARVDGDGAAPLSAADAVRPAQGARSCARPSCRSRRSDEARAAAGAQKQLDEAAAAAQRSARRRRSRKKRQKGEEAAAEAEREQGAPGPPTLGAYIDLEALAEEERGERCFGGSGGVCRRESGLRAAIGGAGAGRRRGAKWRIV